MTKPLSFPKDVSQIPGEYWRKAAEIIISGLNARQMKGFFVQTSREAVDLALSMIPDGAVVSQGGSMTLDQSGLRQALISTDRFRFMDPYAPDLTPEQRMERRKQCLSADVFVCSTNAITLDGILVNRDGIGNRVAAMAFGPEKVIILAGINKIVPDVESAIDRIDRIAAPMNCMRFGRETPCVEDLECTDCDVDGRICAVTTIIDWQWRKDRIHVILIGESLGF